MLFVVKYAFTLLFNVVEKSRRLREKVSKDKIVDLGGVMEQFESILHCYYDNTLRVENVSN
jgi:hypothetical protein